jgi:hypothetical protein
MRTGTDKVPETVWMDPMHAWDGGFPQTPQHAEDRREVREEAGEGRSWCQGVCQLRLLQAPAAVG